MHKAINTIGRRLLSTESEWNPKVALGRAMMAMLPENALHKITKIYYAYLLSRLPDDWQERDASIVRHLVSTGDCVIDIGASIGAYTKFLSAAVGRTGRVYSFEPNPAIYDFLSHNVNKLKLRNVELFDVALSDKSGTASIVIPRYRWGNECHYDATLETKRAQPECRRMEVPVCTLDSFFESREQKIAFIKCDVNYHELACLRGARETIRRSRPAILIEILTNPDKDGGPGALVFELMREWGYEAYWFDGKLLRKRQPGERSQNYFFLTPEHAARLPLPFVGPSTSEEERTEEESLKQ